MTTPKAPSLPSPDEVIEELCLDGHDPRVRSYPGRIDAALVPWHVYTLNEGHCVVVAVADLQDQHPGNPAEFLLPVPVKTVMRAKWERTEQGYIRSRVDYVPGRGVVTTEGDDEYIDGREPK